MNKGEQDGGEIQSLPEMFYGKNRLVIYNEELNVGLSYSPLDAIRDCVDSVRAQHFCGD